MNIRFMLQIVVIVVMQVLARSWALFPMTDVDTLLAEGTFQVDADDESSPEATELTQSKEVWPGSLYHQSVDKREGIGRIDELFQRVVVVDECRRKVADALAGNQPCDVVRRDIDDLAEAQVSFTLAITNCHLQAYGKRTFNDPKVRTVSLRCSI